VCLFLWPPQEVNLSIPSLIWRGTASFVQNNTTIILPDDTRRTTSELPCRAPLIHFWCQSRSLETRNGSYLSLFANYFGFWNCKSLFVDIQCHLQWEKLPDFNAFPDFLTLHQDTKIFPACWILIGQFKFPARQPYARSTAVPRKTLATKVTESRAFPPSVAGAYTSCENAIYASVYI